MKKLIFITLSFLFLGGCFKAEKKTTQGSDHPNIQFLKETYDAEILLMDSLNDNEEFVKYIVLFFKADSVVPQHGRWWIVTDRAGIIFEDGGFRFDGSFQRFTASYKANTKKLQFLKVNFLDFDKILFNETNSKTKTKLVGDFDSLNLGITQKILNFTEKNPSKKNEKTYTYELYNSEGTKKIVQVYHDYGEWFTIDVL